MKYTKPEVVLNLAAVKAVRGMGKISPFSDANQQDPFASVAAYEADE